MRRPRLISLIMALSGCALTAVLVLAGDRPGDDQELRKFSTPPPAKKFDLGTIDTSKPPVEPKPPTKPDQEKPQPKPVIKYRATEIVPEGAEIVLEFPDLSRARREARSSPLGRLLADDQLGPVWSKRVVARLRNVPPIGEGLPDGNALVDVFNRVSELLAGEAVLAVYPPAEGSKQRRLLLVAEMEGVRRTAFLDSVEDLKAWAGLSRETTAQALNKGDFDYQRLTAKSGLSVTYGFVGNQLVVEVCRETGMPGKRLYDDQVLPAAVSRGDKSLSREGARAEAMAALGKDADLYVRAEGRALAETTGPGDGPKAAAARLEGVKYLAAALRFEPRSAREKVFVALDRESRLAKTLPKRAPAGELARFIPLDACVYELERVEPGAATAAFEILRNSLTEPQVNELNKHIELLEKTSKLSLEKDVLPALAGEVATAYAIRTMGATPEVDLLVVMQPDDPEKFSKVVAGLALAAGAKFETEVYLGAEIKYLAEPDAKKDDGPASKKPRTSLEELFAPRMGPALRKEGTTDEALPLPLRLSLLSSYTVFGKYVILGTSSRVVKMAIRQKDPTQHTSSIADKQDFKDARNVLGSPASEVAYGYVDLHRVGELLYALAGAGGHAADLPSADKVLDEITGLAWSVRLEKNGVSIECFSPVGVIPLAVAGSAEGWLNRLDAEAAAEREAHTAKLKTIWRGVELFSTEFGRYPLNLSEVYPTYVPNGSTFLTPDQEKQDPKMTIADAKEVDTKSGYRYVSGRAPNAVGNTILAYSTKPTVRGMHWCLYVNGKVLEVPAKVLADALAGKRGLAGETPAHK